MGGLLLTLGKEISPSHLVPSRHSSEKPPTPPPSAPSGCSPASPPVLRGLWRPLAAARRSEERFGTGSARTLQLPPAQQFLPMPRSGAVLTPSHAMDVWKRWRVLLGPPSPLLFFSAKLHPLQSILRYWAQTARAWSSFGYFLMLG